MVLGQNNLFKRWHRSDCVTYFTLCSLQFHFFYFPNTKKELMLLFSPFFFLPDVKWKICHGLLLEEAEKRVWSHSNLIWSQPPLLWTCTNMEGREGGGKKTKHVGCNGPSWELSVVCPRDNLEGLFVGGGGGRWTGQMTKTRSNWSFGDRQPTFPPPLRCQLQSAPISASLWPVKGRRTGVYFWNNRWWDFYLLQCEEFTFISQHPDEIRPAFLQLGLQ